MQALLAVLLFDERLGTKWFVGAAMILTGVYLLATQSDEENETINTHVVKKKT